MFALLTYRVLHSIDETPINAVYVLSEGLVLVMILMRRATDQISIKPADWLVAFAGTLLPMMLIPSGHGWSGGAVFLIAGLCISVGAKLTLRRSFGIVAANRGIKRTGLYGIVRHPMYLGYTVSNLGALLINPSLFNACLFIIWSMFQIMRIHAEERILIQDPAYKAHVGLVRYRILPLVY